MNLLRSSRQFLRDWSTFGIRFAFASRWPRTWKPRVWRIKLKNGPAISIRTGTADAGTVRDIFYGAQYGYASSGSRVSLQVWYDLIIARGSRPLIIDAGANIGATSLWFADLYPKAKIVAIEPEPANAAMCRLNLGVAGQVVEAAIGSQAGHVDIVDPALGNDAFRTIRSGASGVPVCTIPGLIEEQPDACELFVVKVDIEGFESDLFSSNIEWIKDAKAVLIEPHDWLFPGQGTSQAFQAAMAGEGFEIEPAHGNLLYTRPARPTVHMAS